MGVRDYARRNWKLLLNIATIGALLVLIFALREHIALTLRNLERVNAIVLLMLIPIELLNYHAQARAYQKLFAAFEKKIAYWRLYRISVELNFVNHVFPSGGVSGISYFGFLLKKCGVGAGRATLVQSIKLILLFVSFEILLLFGVLSLALSGKANNLVVLIASALTMLVLFGTLVFVYAISDVGRLKQILADITAGANWLIRLFRPGRPPKFHADKLHGALEEYHRDFLQLKSHIRQLVWPFWWSFVANVTEVAAVYVVYMAFGALVNPGAVILAYAVANFAGLVSVLPGGTGIYEALMTVTLVAAGIPASLSLPVTIMYRVLNTLIQLPPGFVLYQRTLRKSPQEVFQP